VNLNIARHVGGARKVTGIVLPWRIELRGNGGNVAEFPDVDGGADREAAGGDGHAHRFVERAEVRVDDTGVGAEDDELAGLVCCDKE
jgi:hypothetical protein